MVLRSKYFKRIRIESQNIYTGPSSSSSLFASLGCSLMRHNGRNSSSADVYLTAAFRVRPSEQLLWRDLSEARYSSNLSMSWKKISGKAQKMTYRSCCPPQLTHYYCSKIQSPISYFLQQARAESVAKTAESNFDAAILSSR